MRTRKRWPEGTWMRLRSADTLRVLMRQSHFSLGEMADLVGCSKGFISHLLAGRRGSCTPDLATRIAGVLRVPVEDLFDPRMSTASMLTGKSRAA